MDKVGCGGKGIGRKMYYFDWLQPVVDSTAHNNV